MRGSLADAVDSRLGAEVFGPHPYAHEPAGDPAAIAEAATCESAAATPHAR